MNPQLGAWAALCALLALGRLAFVAAISVDPCGPLDPVKRVRARFTSLQCFASLQWRATPSGMGCAAHARMAPLAHPTPRSCVHQGGDAFVVGIALWPGGTGDDWGPPESGLNPCNATDRANLVGGGCTHACPPAAPAHGPAARTSALGMRATGPPPTRPAHHAISHPPIPPQTAAGAHFASYAVRVDRLSVLKTTFPEQLALTSSAAPGTPLVMSAVAFR